MEATGGLSGSIESLNFPQLLMTAPYSRGSETLILGRARKQAVRGTATRR
jgi:hypothetical protein